MDAGAGEPLKIEAGRELSVPADARLIPPLGESLNALLCESGFGEKFAHDVELAFEEATVNVIKHTYREDRAQSLRILVDTGPGSVTVTLKDQGPPLSPEAIPDVDLAAYKKSKKRGGLGVYLMRQLMDDVVFLPGLPLGNTLVMSKRVALLSRLAAPIGREALKSLREAVQARGSQLGFPQGLITDLALIADEIATNVKDHSGATWLNVYLTRDGNLAALRFLDDGAEFDTVEACSYMDRPVLGSPVERHMGLYLIEKTDFIKSYLRLDGKLNELKFSRTLGDVTKTIK